MEDFLRGLPKVELHAHLNGSLHIDSIKELAENVYGKQSPEFDCMCKRFITFEKGATLDECFQKFNFVHELTSTVKGLEYATDLAIRDFSRDKVMYVELRTTPKSTEHMSRRTYLETVVESIIKAANRYKIMVKLLPSINRSEPVKAAEETVALALELRAKVPEIIVGIDFSGNPHCGKFADFKPILEEARQCGLKLAIHCAEIENDAEIREMISFGMSRCGHGTFLKSSGFAIMKEKDIPIECCLSSNVKSGTVPRFSDHHLKDLLLSEAPKVLCTDDCGVFNSTLSEEFILAWKCLGVTRSLSVDMTMNAVNHSFASREEQLEMKMQLYDYIRENPA